MLKNPRCSIIVPNFNHGLFLDKRMESILTQTFQDFEIILLDDASKDNSVEILRKYACHPKVSHFEINKENSGTPFKQWEKGIAIAKGEYIWIAESDDYCEPCFLEKIFCLIQECKEYPRLVYTQSLDVDEKGRGIMNRIEYTSEFKPNIWKNDFIISGKELIEQYLKVKNIIPNASAVVFKKNLVATSSFNEIMVDMKMCGDWWLWVNIIKKTKVGFIAEPLNYFRTHSGISRKHESRKKMVQRLLEESQVRRLIANSQEVDQHQEKIILYQKWLQLHQFRDLKSKQFYEILISKSEYITLLKLFFKSRLYGIR